jgi:hypothetical protein
MQNRPFPVTLHKPGGQGLGTLVNVRPDAYGARLKLRAEV